MNQVSLSALLIAGLFGTSAFGFSASAGPSIHAEAESRFWQALAWLDRDEPSTRSDARPVAPGVGSDASGGAPEVEAYIRFHLETAAGDARSQLMPWPELRSLAQ